MNELSPGQVLTRQETAAIVMPPQFDPEKAREVIRGHTHDGHLSPETGQTVFAIATQEERFRSAGRLDD